VNHERYDLWDTYFERHFLKHYEDPHSLITYDDLVDSEEEEEEEEEGKEKAAAPVSEYAKKSMVTQRRCLIHAEAVHIARAAFERLRSDRTRPRCVRRGASEASVNKS
jgi:hypothetical protein